MANIVEVSRFFRLALRVGLIDTAAVDRWVDSLIAAEPIVKFPFTELAGASVLRRVDVDRLLEQVVGDGDCYIPGRMVMALLCRRVREGKSTPDSAVKLAIEITRAGGLTEQEFNEANNLDDGLWLATSGTYGDLKTVQSSIVNFLEQYQKFDEQIPAVF